jgi:hypothetical protein
MRILLTVFLTADEMMGRIAVRPRLPLTNPEEKQGQQHAEEAPDERGRSKKAEVPAQVPEQSAEPDIKA